MKILLVALMWIVASCSTQQTQNKIPIKLYVFDCGKNKVKDISLFSPGHDEGVTKTLVARCYLIKHPQGTLMWDTGLNDSLINKKNGLAVRGGAFILSVEKTLSSQLKEININSSDVDFVSFSHMHPDHSGNANLFKNSRVLIQKEEFDAAFGKSPEKYSFNKALYSELDKEKVIKLSGDHDVFGDGLVKIITTPGHTPGHQSLYVKLPKYGKVILSGDLYHFKKNRDYKRAPVFNFDKEMTFKSMDKLEDLIKKTSAELWIQHDPDQAKSIKMSPEFYE